MFGFKRCESVKLLQYYYFEFPLEYTCIYDLQKWKFLSNTYTVSDRFVALYHFKKHTLDNLSQKYSFNSCVSGMKCALLLLFLRYVGVFNFCILMFCVLCTFPLYVLCFFLIVYLRGELVELLSP